MSKTIIWHNPRCSKSREALKLLEEQGEAVEIFKYLDETISQEDISQAADRMGKLEEKHLRTLPLLQRGRHLKIEKNHRLFDLQKR